MRKLHLAQLRRDRLANFGATVANAGHDRASGRVQIATAFGVSDPTALRRSRLQRLVGAMKDRAHGVLSRANQEPSPTGTPTSEDQPASDRDERDTTTIRSPTRIAAGREKRGRNCLPIAPATGTIPRETSQHDEPGESDGKRQEDNRKRDRRSSR